MTHRVDGQLIESLSSQPLGSSHWLQRARFAGELIFGAEALALVCHSTGEGFALIGLVDSNGSIVLEPSDQIEYANTSRMLSSMAGLEPLEQALSRAHLFDLGLPAESGRLLPWPLGMQKTFAFVLINPNTVTTRESLPRGYAFLSVANNLLRRATKRALVDAGAWIQAEIDKLANLQNLLQPDDLEELEGVEFAVHSQPHAYAGGDYFDIANVRDSNRHTHCLISVADVSGHGPAAVVETAMIDSILRTFSDAHPREAERGPARVMTYLNRHMFTRRPRPSFATMFASELDILSGTLRYCLAGHPPPIRKSPSSGLCEFIPAGEGIPLQILRDYEWQELHLQMQPGDTLVVYSDGITEALSPAGVQFGQSNLLSLVESGSDNPQTLLAEILDELNRHAEHRPFHDDQTLVIAKWCDGRNK